MSDQDQRKLNICMLLPYFYQPDMRVYPRIQICSNVTDFGHHVTWVMSDADPFCDKEFSFGRVKGYALSYRIHCHRSWILAEFLNKLHHLIGRVRFVLRLFQKNRYDIIFVRTDIFDGILALYIRHKYGIPFVYELPNPVEQSRHRLKIEHRKPEIVYDLMARLFENVTIMLARRADLVLPISRALKDDLVQNKKIPDARVLVIPEGADVKLFSQADGTGIKNEHRLNDFIVLVYAGTINELRKPAILIEILAKVRAYNDKVKLLVVGDGNGRRSMEELAHRMSVYDNVVFAGQVLQSKVADYIAAADIGLSPVPPLSHYKLSSPIKIFEYLASGKPVVANEEISEHKEVLEQSGGGIPVAYNSAAFADAVIDLVNNPRKAVEMGRKGQEWVIANRSFEVLSAELEKRYMGLCRQ